jgi:hypothetical protein
VSISRFLAMFRASILHRDIAPWASMHEDYIPDISGGLAPTVAQSPRAKFASFVGWNLLAQGMLQCEVANGHCLTLAIPEAP